MLATLLHSVLAARRPGRSRRSRYWQPVKAASAVSARPAGRAEQLKEISLKQKDLEEQERQVGPRAGHGMEIIESSCQ